MKQLFLDAGFKTSKKVNIGNMAGHAPRCRSSFSQGLINPLLKWLAKNGIYFMIKEKEEVKQRFWNYKCLQELCHHHIVQMLKMVFVIQFQISK